MSDLFSRPWHFIRIDRGLKKSLDQWKTIPPAGAAECAGHNVAARNGRVSDWLVTIDGDVREVWPAMRALLPTPAGIYGRKSKPASKYIYRVLNAEDRIDRYADVDGEMIIEYHADGYDLLPGSINPSGEPVEWVDEGTWPPPNDTDETGLRSAVRLCAVVGLVGRHWPKGNRHFAAMHLSGFLLAQGVSNREVEIVIEETAKAARDEEINDRVQVARDTIKTFHAKEPVTGGPSLADLIGADVVKKLRQYFGDRDENPDHQKDRLKNLERIKREIRRELDAEDRPAVEPPACLTLRERLALPQVEITWRIQDWLPVECRAMLAAQFKAGKTTFVQNTIRSLVDGDPFLGRHQVTPIAKRVVLLDFEMSSRQLDAWFRDQQIQHADRVVVVPLRGAAGSFDIRLPEVRARWVERLRELQCSFLIVDCLRPIMDALGLNEHAEAGLLLTALDALLKEAGIPEAIVVHHMGHNGERSRGDSRLRDWPDVEWRLVRQDEDPASERFITAFGRDVDVPESKLEYDNATRRMTIAGGSRREAKAEAALPAVLEIVKAASEPLSAHKIERALADSDHSRDVVRKAIRLAVRDGVLVKDLGGQGGGARYSKGADGDVEF